MIEQTEVILVIAVFALLALAALLMARRLGELSRDFNNLRASVDGNSRDFADLRSGVVEAYQQLISGQRQLSQSIERMAATEKPATHAGPYGDAIRKITDGSSVEEIMQDCGLSRDEAMLLLRMQGKGRDERL